MVELMFNKTDSGLGWDMEAHNKIEMLVEKRK